MKFLKEENTKVRYEKDGIYVMNAKYQTKAKITDLENEGKQFFDAINSQEVENTKEIKNFIQKKFIVPFSNYQEQFNGKSLDHTSKPIYMTLGITSGCNFKCKHCGNNSKMKKKTDLTEEEIYIILDQMIEMNILKLNFTGGEPTTNNNLIKYIKHVKGRIPRITMTSNGSLITKEKAKELKQAGLNMAKISIDGLSSFHNYFRKHENAYEKAIEAIKNLKECGIEVRVQSTLTKDNRENLLQLMWVLSRLGVSHQTIVPVCPIGRAEKEMMLTSAEYKEFVIKMYEQVVKLSKKGSKTSFQIRPVFGARELFEGLKTSFETLSLKYSCEALENTIEIQPNGDVVPCSFLSIPIGNVRKNSIEEIWNSNKAEELRKLFKSNKENEYCSNCSKNSICNGGCIANKYYYGNDFKAKEPYCFVN